MSRFLRNWNYRQVGQFLRSRGFVTSEIDKRRSRGSHCVRWVDPENGRVIRTYFPHKTGHYGVVDMKFIMRNSGIDRQVWFNWANGAFK